MWRVYSESTRPTCLHKLPGQADGFLYNYPRNHCNQVYHYLRIAHRGYTRPFFAPSPQMICAPTFDHKIGNAAHSGVSEVFVPYEIPQVEEMDNRKATPRDNVFLKISRWLTTGSNHNRNFSMWTDFSLLFPCSNSHAESFIVTFAE